MSITRVLILAFWILSSVPYSLSASMLSWAGQETAMVPPAVPAKKIVDARLLATLVKYKGVALKNAIIRGPLNLSYLTINQQVSLLNCEFEDRADFSYATFKRHLDLRNSTFKKGLDFRAATVELNGIFDGLNVLFIATVPKSIDPEHREKILPAADFRHFHVQGVFSMRGARFDSTASAYFGRADFDKDVDLEGSVFGANARLGEMQVGGDLLMQNTHFKGEAGFTTTKIAGSLFLEKAQFDDVASFAGMQTAYSAKLPRATFKNRANFSEIEVNGFLDLSGATFGWTERPVNFSMAHVLGGGFFDSVQFADGARFDNAHFNSDVSFENTVFDGVAQFDKAHFDQAAHFEKCVFKEDASFNEAVIGSIKFAQSRAVKIKDRQTGKVVNQDQFQARVDLRGCLYSRILLDWQSALKMPDGTPRLVGNDRQPYSELEKYFRDTGDDAAADGVSLTWHRLKRQETFGNSKPAWLLDCISWFLTNYGVAPGRLLDLSAILLLFGTLVFSVAGAVVKSGDKGQKGDSALCENGVKLCHWDAFALSVHEFLPLEVPFGSRWTPGSEPVCIRLRWKNHILNLIKIRPSTYATLLKIGGYVLVPLQILVLNGLMRGGQQLLGS